MNFQRLRNNPPIYDIYNTFGNLNTDWIIIDMKELLTFLCVIMVFKSLKQYPLPIFGFHTAVFLDRMNLQRKAVWAPARRLWGRASTNVCFVSGTEGCLLRVSFMELSCGVVLRSWRGVGTETAVPASKSWVHPCLWSPGFPPAWPYLCGHTGCGGPWEWALVRCITNQDRGSVGAQPVFGRGEHMGGASFPILNIRPSSLLLSRPSGPPLCCLSKVKSREAGEPWWEKASSLNLASFFLSCKAQQFRAPSTTHKAWGDLKKDSAAQAWKTSQCCHPNIHPAPFLHLPCPRV